MVNAGSERTDSTRGVNLGLPGVTTDLGNGQSSYRSITANEVSSNRSAHEYAKRNGLTPSDSGRFRTLGS